MQRALVTGITGFVGTHLARALAQQGSVVHALVRPGARLDRIADLREQVTVHSVGPSYEDVHSVIARIRPEVCFHLATHFVVQPTPADIDSLAESNIAFPMRLVEALADAECARIVNTGTAWQHVGGAPYRPKTLYAATKQACDDVLAYYAWSGRLAVVTLRLFDTYGPDDTRGKLLATLLRTAATGESLAMSSGETLIDLVHIDDVTEALLAAARTPLPDGGPPARYAVSSGEPVRLRDLVDLVRSVTGRDVPVRWGERADRPDEMLVPWDAGPPLPDWLPRVTLREGIQRMATAQS